ncbi:hypothetical protein BT63DRAFT_415354 [Microthyrium microscopicum]|uniref:C2H2-type domain-containing protein n=1 Tax=Microthyrium microscopicum TaxID=703497 RepID=A0A6A6U6N4_9PEZI|nr:hypothetical protein BT63DRAFT_415354 [Microthyrium microscopicum]
MVGTGTGSGASAESTSPAPSTSNRFPCNSCAISFGTSEAQREHMKQPWHVYNLKRKMAKLPPITYEVFHDKFEEQMARVEKDMFDLDVEDEDEESELEESEGSRDIKNVAPSQCLFCSTDSTTLDQNIAHMLSEHSFFIPDPEHLVDKQTLITYLRLIISQYHECLYCGTARNSAEGIRQHMADKGHCMINFDTESELLDFWDFSGSTDNSDEEEDQNENNTPAVPGPSKFQKSPQPHSLSSTELRLPSGRLITSRAHTPVPLNCLLKKRTQSKRTRKAITNDSLEPKDEISREQEAQGTEDTQTPAATGTSGSSSRQIARRGELGLLGLSDAQKQAVMVTERKMQRKEKVTRQARQWAIELSVERRKYYVPDGPGRPGRNFN